MTPELTNEQRQAIEQQNGQPVYVVDSDRHQTYVLLTQADFAKVKPLLENGVSDEPWTDEKNERRLQLIDKRISMPLDPEEEIELARLQRQAEQHFDSVAPPPMQGVQQIHKQLLGRRDNQ